MYKSPLQIVVAQRGFVLVGRVRAEGDQLIIDACANVRRWGTTKGLGQLAAEGPKPETKLDEQPTTYVHQLAVVQRINCTEAVWDGR